MSFSCESRIEVTDGGGINLISNPTETKQKKYPSLEKALTGIGRERLFHDIRLFGGVGIVGGSGIAAIIGIGESIWSHNIAVKDFIYEAIGMGIGLLIAGRFMRRAAIINSQEEALNRAINLQPAQSDVHRA